MTNIRIYVTSIDSVATQKSTNRELFRSFLSTSREQWKSHVLGTHFQLFPTINREAFSFLFRFNLFSSFSVRKFSSSNRRGFFWVFLHSTQILPVMKENIFSLASRYRPRKRRVNLILCRK